MNFEDLSQVENKSVGRLLSTRDKVNIYLQRTDNSTKRPTPYSHMFRSFNHMLILKT